MGCDSMLSLRTESEEGLACSTAQLMEAHLWRVNLDHDSVPVRAHHILSQEEMQRAQSFRSPQLKHRFIAVRLALRTLLGHYLGVPPQTLEFAATPYGKPYLPHFSGFHFNLSHSDRLAIIAISLGSFEIGVDIERITPDFDWIPTAELSFTEAEWERLRSAPEQQKRNVFFGTWTRKEAYIKGIGLGLSLDPRLFCTASNAPGPTIPVATARGTSDGLRWHVFDFSPEPGYAGALACTVSAAIRHFRYGPEA
jgi:4'-phosphopantetheinyl transferase